MRQNWFEIISIWVLVAFGAVLCTIALDGDQLLGAYAVLLAGSLAMVSLIQLFRAQPAGFVRRLVYVAGGSYFILVVATAVIWLRG